MTSTSPAERLKQIADEIRAIGSEQRDSFAGRFDSFAFGVLIQEAVSLGAFANAERAPLRATLAGIRVRAPELGIEAHRSASFDTLVHFIEEQYKQSGMPVSDLSELYRKVADEVFDTATKAPGGMKGRPSGRRRQRTIASSRPMTAKEIEAVHAVAECKGNFEAAARQLGKHRKTVFELYRSGMKKAAANQVRHRTERLRMDRRGQDVLSTEDDRR